jgi:WD40 repeat protein
MTEAVLATGGQYLQDGFQEIFSFRGHKLTVRGIDTVEVSDHSSSSHSRKHDQFISWDVKAILLWEDACDGSPPRVLSRFNFPKNQPQYICAVVYIPKMKVFLAAALDMTFKIFDKQFRLLQEFHHDERAILSLQYDADRGIVICSGASGITVWRCYRNLSLDNCHVVEKMFTFDGCEHWVSSMIYEPQSGKLYALVDRSVHVLSFAKRAVVTVLKDIHESPVTTVCWYARSQFYLTGCSQGLIKCWTSHFRDVNKLQNMGSAKENLNAGNEEDEDVRSVRYALLHTFFCHSKAITGLILHSTSGLAISTSLDGFVKVLNLEAFNELFCVDTGMGITGMKGIRYGLHMACLFSQSNGRIRLWKVTSCCNFFGISAASIESIDCFDNLQIDDTPVNSNPDEPLSLGKSSDIDHKKDAALARSMSGGSLAESASDGIDDEEDEGFYSSGVDDLYEELSDETGLEAFMKQQEGGAGHDHQAHDSHKHAGHHGHGHGHGHGHHKDHHHHHHHHVIDHANHGKTRLVASYAAQDLRVYNQHGGLVCRVEPTEVVDGIHSYTISVFQELLFCLLLSGKVKIYCCRSPHSPLVKEVAVTKKSREQVGTSLCLIDVVPHTANAFNTRGGGESSNQKKVHMTLRGEHIAADIQELLILGDSTGTMLFMDTLGDMEICGMFQASTGPIHNIRYRKARKELFGLCFNYITNGLCVRVWRMPGLHVLCNTATIQDISCFDISPTLSAFGVGCTDGFMRLFKTDYVGIGDSACIEIERLCLMHEGPVVALSFCDPLQLYATSAMDSTVKIWDMNKRLIRSIKFNLPPTAISFHGKLGDIVISQKNYLLQTTMMIWNEGNYLQKVQETEDPWAKSDLLNDDDPRKAFSRDNAKNAVDMQQLAEILRSVTPHKAPVTAIEAGQESKKETSIHRAPKSTEFSNAVSIVLDNSAPQSLFGSSSCATTESVEVLLPVHSPRFYYETKPPVNYRIPEVDDAVSKELEKEEQLIQQLRHEREVRELSMGLRTDTDTPNVVDYSMNEDVINNRSLYIARTAASLGMSPRARMVLLKHDVVGASDHSDMFNDSAESLQFSIEARLKEVIGPQKPPSPAPPSATSTMSAQAATTGEYVPRASFARKTMVQYSAGRATVVVTKPAFNMLADDTETSRASPIFETMEETSIVPIPGEVLLSSQFRSDRQTFIARKARLRNPDVVPDELANAAMSSAFKRGRAADGPTAEAAERAVLVMKQKAEEAQRLQLEEEEIMRRQRLEKQHALTEAQKQALAKLRIPAAHIGQLMERHSMSKGRRKSGVGRATHISVDPENSLPQLDNPSSSPDKQGSNRRKSVLNDSSSGTVEDGDAVASKADDSTPRMFSSIASISSAFDRSMRFTQVAGLQSVVENLEVELESQFKEPLPVVQEEPSNAGGSARRISKRESFKDPHLMLTRRESTRTKPQARKSIAGQDINSLHAEFEAAKPTSAGQGDPNGPQASAGAPTNAEFTETAPQKDWVNESLSRASMIISSVVRPTEERPSKLLQQKRKTDYQTDPRMRSTFRVHGGGTNT